MLALVKARWDSYSLFQDSLDQLLSLGILISISCFFVFFLVMERGRRMLTYLFLPRGDEWFSFKNRKWAREILPFGFWVCSSNAILLYYPWMQWRCQTDVFHLNSKICHRESCDLLKYLDTISKYERNGHPYQPCPYSISENHVNTWGVL